MYPTLYQKGSEWRKWDLHFHTPSSYDYQDKSVTNEQIIDTLSANNISVVAVTDHHLIDVERISELKLLGEKKGITVLPGIEFLSDARGRQPIHFIGIFAESSNIEYIWGQLQNKTEIHKIVGEKKEVNQVYCDLSNTIELIKELGGIVSIHAGEKSNSIENITHSLPHGEAQKTDVAHAVDIYELGKEADQNGYKEIVFPAIKKKIPMIIASDNHNINNYLVKQWCWIKADPNFEGLKQIIHEPEERIKIQAAIPEDKSGYQVIDRIELKSSYIFNSKIEINANLNSIIGGRSAGKSVLLAAIAKKLKTDKPVIFEHNMEYDEFVADISSAINIFWKDQEENDQREIEYFQQGYMHDLARKEAKLSKLIQDILKQKGKESILNNYERFVSDNKKRISELISDLFGFSKDLYDKDQKISDRGDKKGIEDEITRLSEELRKLNNTEITDEERNIYDNQKQVIEGSKHKKTIITNDISAIESLKSQGLIKDNITYQLTSISEERRVLIDEAFAQVKKEFNERWLNVLESLIDSASKKLTLYDEEIERATMNETYQKVLKAFQDSSQLVEYENKIQVQKDKLFEITALIAEKEELKKQISVLRQDIINLHRLFYEKISEILPSLSESTDGLEIKAKAKFNTNAYRDILISGLNQQGVFNQRISDFKYIDNTAYEVHLTSLFDKLIKNELTLKGGYTNQTLLNALLADCFYYLSYDIEYDGDDFMKMSDGKKAFVVLKLLLDFSNKDCPILIDQPEDDLDNRAIYLDLVQYLKSKKKVRQIIVATHNPNIVVGADSELIIVANQDGIKNVNKGRKKFQYISGSLEYTCKKDDRVEEVLDCQGIREHICEILEGGDKAFKLREKKYSLPKQLVHAF